MPKVKKALEAFVYEIKVWIHVVEEQCCKIDTLSLSLPLSLSLSLFQEVLVLHGLHEAFMVANLKNRTLQVSISCHLDLPLYIQCSFYYCYYSI